jgi:Bacitracin resistance protein BacA
LAQSPNRRRKDIKLFRRQSIFRIRTPKIIEVRCELLNDRRIHWVVDAGNDFDIALVESDLHEYFQEVCRICGL